MLGICMRKYICNENFFDELNEKSAYWVGFIAGDGCVRKHNYSYVLKIALATKDISHLEAFKKDIEFTGPVNSYTIINKDKSKTLKKDKYFSSQVSITSKHIFNKLGDYNVVPNKTYIYSVPDIIKNSKYVNHFVRGCIDSDGWIIKHKNNGSLVTTNIRVGFCGTENFVKDVFNIIKNNLSISGGDLIKRDDINWNFQFEKKEDVHKIIEWIYEDATVFLQRKKDNADMASEFYKNILKYDNFLLSEEELKSDYDVLKSIKEISKKYNRSKRIVSKRMRELGLDYKNKDKPKNVYNDFFDFDSEKKFYWVGFLAGKSSIINRGGKINLAINTNDKSIIDKFTQDSGMSINVCQMESKSKINYQGSIFDDDIIKKLSEFNITADKDVNYKIPEKLLNNEQLRHLLRGYFDARSSLQINEKIIFTVKNNKCFINQINDIFNSNGILITAKIKEYEYNKSHEIRYIGSQAKNILNYLYKDATIYLDRKYDKIKHLLDK
jgi:hypothetical protein